MYHNTFQSTRLFSGGFSLQEEIIYLDETNDETYYFELFVYIWLMVEVDSWGLAIDCFVYVALLS